ncbi:ammonium transporter, Amt family [Actinokineospora alba]|uniref:Ammonium transporter n=1 Tax=Actinokineospora alba TaxID=504798 RepID=A0A1H0I466_9PSEU|nr:ammonium transporter [Actinokineospora alba]TDP64612.1 Amt family ammonium transporter [Actinokineospora alba]SDI85968.1 ammonium transporter, Amt family [Actinokineospora alba]SDO26195.1 ammonium transporter, Amt family [Actinokineospora alba]
MNAGDTAWVLISAALVMLMTPGLAFFYGGMVRAKSVLNMLMMSFISLGVVTVLWVLYGYSLTFGNDLGGGLLGGFDFVNLGNIVGTLVGVAPADAAAPWVDGHQIPHVVFVVFQLMFAIITAALISGAIADRAKFWSWTIFIAFWVTIVYFPVAHWVFNFNGVTGTDFVGGWIANKLGALDFAGGTAVHINAGAAALALVLVLGKRKGWPREPMRPHNLPFVLLGAGLLWFGWYGFNAGSALGAGDLAGVAFLTTTAATAAAILGWLVVEQIRDGKPTTLGAASGAIAGLVAITPACGFVNPLGALAIGLVAGVLCALAVSLKFKLGYDDSLDVVGVHLVGGLTGTILIGLFATTSVNSAGKEGLFYGGGLDLLGKQAVAAGAVMAYSFVATLVIAFIIQKTIGFRVSAEAEATGIDEAEHAESGYEFSSLRSGGTTTIKHAEHTAEKVSATAGKEG